MEFSCETVSFRAVVRRHEVTYKFIVLTALAIVFDVLHVIQYLHEMYICKSIVTK